MDVNSTVGLLQLATAMSEDVLMAAKIQEAFWLQNNRDLLMQLATFQMLLDDVYGISCPTSDDYARRGDLIRIFNDIAREIYGDNDKCPVVEIFGSFVMDMFSAKSDLDLSINFSDQLFETDLMAKRRTLRKFAKKFYALRSKGHVTTVELILSARVPVLKVTDSVSGIECDLSVGNRDGIAKSRIVFLVSSIDQRFRQLSFMMKAWAKAHDINSSKDGTLNSLSLILLAAFHLQTRDIPILPPFSAIFKDGTDPAAVKNIIPSFLNFGKENKESLAELFVSLLIKLESVEKLWSRGLSASTFEGSWICRNSKANGYMSIEDFTDRSQNTARAVKSAQLNKIYSCIHRSVELIRSFIDGVVDATQLKNLLFGLGPRIRTLVPNLNYSGSSKIVCSNPSKKRKKNPTQGGPVKGQRPGKQGKHGYNLCSMEAPRPSGIRGVNNNKSMGGKKTDPGSSDIPSLFQGLDNSQETPTTNLSQGKKNPPTQGDPAEGQRCDKKGKHGLHSCSMDGPAPSSKRPVKKKKSKTGIKTDPASSDTPKGLDKLKESFTPNSSQKQKNRPIQGAPSEGQKSGKKGKHGLHPCTVIAPAPSGTRPAKKKKSKTLRKTDPASSNTPKGLDKLEETPTPNLGQKQRKRPIQGAPAKGQRRGKKGKYGLHSLNMDGPTPSKTSGGKKMKSRIKRKTDPATSGIPTCFQGLGKSQEALIGSFQPHPILPTHGSGGYKSQRADIVAFNSGTPTFQVGQPHNNQSSVGYGVYGPSRTHVSNLNHIASSLPAERPSLSTPPIVQYVSQSMYADSSSNGTPRFPEGHPAFISNRQVSGGYRPNIAHPETLRHAAPNLLLREPLPFSGNEGFRSERTNVDTLNHATPSFPSYQPFSHSNQLHSQDYGGSRSKRYHVETSNQQFPHSNHQHSQDYGEFRSERHHVEILNQPFSRSNHQYSQNYSGSRSQSHHVDTSRHAPNYPSSTWVSVSNQPGPLPKMHVELPNYPVSKSQSPYLTNFAPGFGPERSHAVISNNTTHFQPASYTLGSRPSSFGPPHQPYFPSALHREPAGLPRSFDPCQAALVPSQYAANMNPYQS